MGKKRRQFTAEFKLEAVKQVVEGGRPVREVARGLGISDNLLHRWKKKYLESGELPFPGQGNRQTTGELEEEIRRLRKELADSNADREILKKAAAYFAKHQS